MPNSKKQSKKGVNQNDEATIASSSASMVQRESIQSSAQPQLTLESVLANPRKFENGGSSPAEPMESILMSAPQNISAQIRPSVSETTRTISLENLDQATSIVEKVGTVASKLAEWEESSTNLEQAWTGIQNLDKVNKLLGTTAFFAKASAGLGVLGAGLGLISAIATIGEPSDTEKILNAIGALDEKMDDLSNKMDAGFKNLRIEGDMNTAKIQIEGHLNTLRALQALVKEYHLKANDEESKASVASRLLEFDRAEIFKAVTGLANNLSDAVGSANFLKSVYEKSNGSIKSVTEVGSYLFAMAKFGVVADALINSLISQKENGEVTESQMIKDAQISDDLYQPLLLLISTAWNNYNAKCISEVYANSKAFMEKTVIPIVHVTQHQKSSQGILSLLGTQWFWLDWAVIVYDPVGGWSTHGCSGWNVHTFFRVNAIGGKVNIITHFTEKSVPANGASKSTATTRKAYTGPGILKAAAEEVPWESVADLIDSLDTPVEYPGFVWACKRYQGVYSAWSNHARKSWNNGKYFTVAIYK